jgi:predicted Zn-dependent peptidase
MEFKWQKLANGLVIIGELNESAKSSAAGFFVRTGSRDEDAQINGVSHFLEHMLFKGTEKLNSFEVNQAFDNTGAQFNAFTSEESTVFYAAVLPEYLEEIVELWAQLMRPALREDDFNVEKNVIKEEIAMYKDLPSFDISDRCRALYFDGHPCGNSVLGSEDSIDALRVEQMRGYFQRRYAPNNIILACTGKFDWNHICSLAEKSCAGWRENAAQRVLKPSSGNITKQRITKANLVREHICLMSAAVSAQDPRRFAASLLSTIIGDDNGSRFFWELVDKALAEEASMQFNDMDGTGVLSSYLRCSSENLSRVLDIINDIFLELSKKGVTADELKKAKNKTLSALVLKNELPMGRLIDVGFNWIYLQRYLTIEEEVTMVKAVTVDDINLLIEQLKPGDFTQLIMGPDKE